MRPCLKMQCVKNVLGHGQAGAPPRINPSCLISPAIVQYSLDAPVGYCVSETHGYHTGFSGQDLGTGVPSLAAQQETDRLELMN